MYPEGRKLVPLFARKERPSGRMHHVHGSFVLTSLMCIMYSDMQHMGSQARYVRPSDRMHHVYGSYVLTSLMCIMYYDMQQYGLAGPTNGISIHMQSANSISIRMQRANSISTHMQRAHCISIHMQTPTRSLHGHCHCYCRELTTQCCREVCLGERSEGG